MIAAGTVTPRDLVRGFSTRQVRLLFKVAHAALSQEGDAILLGREVGGSTDEIVALWELLDSRVTA